MLPSTLRRLGLAFRIEWWVRGLFAVGMMAGCAGTPSYKAAGCDRFRFSGYNILACDDTSVGIYCAKGGRSVVQSRVRAIPIADNGKVVDYAPRACYNPRGNYFGRKGNLIVGKSFMTCIPHELAHIEHPNEAAWVEKNFPCVGDKR